MVFLSPLGLVWLAGIPVLLWLWRLAATERRIQVPSLIPFEHLLKRAPKRRTRLVVNLLFWLQLAALIGLALTLARPALVRDRAKTVLVVLDTSASMGASARGATPFERARQAALAALARKQPTEQWLVMITAPVAALTPEPTSDGIVLARALQALRVSDLGGNLATAARIGRALLGEPTEDTLVLTDEPPPTDGEAHPVRWVSVGADAEAPNVAFVGLDAQGPLCNPEAARIIATVQNFSEEEATVAVSAGQAGRRFAEQTVTLQPQARQPVSLALPEGVSGVVDLELTAPRDGLAVDNRAWIEIRQAETRPIIIRSRSGAFTPPHGRGAGFTATLSRWLEACPALQWAVESPPAAPVDKALPADNAPAPSSLVITDEEEQAAGASAAMIFRPPANPMPIRSHWVASSQHPIGAYLSSVELVSAALDVSAAPVGAGTPVIVGLVSGRQLPIVVAEERDGLRRVLVRLDPSAGEPATSVLLAFFNSLRWLLGGAGTGTTGEAITVSGFAPGTVTVSRPDGSVELLHADRGTIRYDATTLAGRYRVSQGGVEQAVAVNFLDPLESNLARRVSTWQVPPSEGAPPAASRKTHHPLANLFAMVILILLLAEWWGYSRKRA